MADQKTAEESRAVRRPVLHAAMRSSPPTRTAMRSGSATAVVEMSKSTKWPRHPGDLRT